MRFLLLDVREKYVYIFTLEAFPARSVVAFPPVAGHFALEQILSTHNESRAEVSNLGQRSAWETKSHLPTNRPTGNRSVLEASGRNSDSAESMPPGFSCFLGRFRGFPARDSLF